jgi:hypothetical protein
MAEHMISPIAPAPAPSADKAERLRRLRATACSTVVQRDEPQTPCAGEPVVAARFDAGQFVVVDMAHAMPAPSRSMMAALLQPVAEPPLEQNIPPAGVPIYRLDAAESGPPRPALLRVAAKLADTPSADAPAVVVNHVFPVSEACRSLCRKLRARLPAQPGTLAWVHSAAEADNAQRLVEVALGMLAQGAKRVLLVDADFANGRISDMFDLAGAQGLEESLKQPSEAGRFVRSTSMNGLDVLARGDSRPHHVRVSRESWQRILANLKSTHDAILIDASCDAEFRESAHILTLAAVADAVCVAVTLEQTPRRQALDLVERLQSESAHVLGCILLNAPADAMLAAA